MTIEYSSDGGGLWTTIVESTEDDGVFNWIIPAEPSTECLVRISEDDVDGGISDISDAVFSIVQPGSASLSLRSPNGGESWETGSRQDIKWTSAGDITAVTISYSRDNGITWRMIARTTPNDGGFDWLVPDTISDECLLRVSAESSDLDPTPSDISDAVFSIVPSSSQFIRISTPNGGEQLVVGSYYDITWVAAGSREDVRVEYSVNGGGTWMEITGSTESSGKYGWIVPDTPSETCLVRISGVDGQPVDISDGLFSIIKPSAGDITVTAPNGGELWPAGSLQEITWTAGGVDQVRIDYSHDYGTTWTTVTQSTPNSGSFDWTVPGTISDACLVRITSDDVSGDPIPSDISDRVFSIVLASQDPTITVVAPNGGEQLIVGKSTSITWNAVSSREDVKIEYSYDGGDSWVILTDAVDSNGDFEWMVPDTPSETCLVRISEIDGQPVDISDAVFSIVSPIPGEVTVLAPNGGELWTVGSLQEVAWSAGGINTVLIQYSTDYGTTWQTVAQSTPNDSVFEWVIPDTVSDGCLVRVAASDADSDPRPSDISDDLFSIIPDSAGELKLTSPNGGEEWEVGSYQSITWINSGNAGSVTIEYSTDIGITWSTIAASAANTGIYGWQVPYTVSHDCLVRVTVNDGSGDPRPSDTSDELFSLVLPSSPTLTVIAPNGGEELIVGWLYEITWFSMSSRQEVQIEYSVNGGDAWTEITPSTANDGEYDWIVPDEPSATCLVRISEVAGQLVDISDAVFSIAQPIPGDLTLLAPNGGEYLEAGWSYDITWTSSGINTVILEYSPDNGGVWIYIDEVPADNGSYPWIVPGTPSDSCLVRISGADSDETPWDVSDGVFTIADLSAASIEVLTLNGGENLGVGEEYYVTWASTGVATVFIEYTTTAGDQWIHLDTVAAAGGRFTWIVPNTPSDSCLIRVSGSDPDDPADISDAVFSIELFTPP